MRWGLDGPTAHSRRTEEETRDERSSGWPNRTPPAAEGPVPAGPAEAPHPVDEGRGGGPCLPDRGRTRHRLLPAAPGRVQRPRHLGAAAVRSAGGGPGLRVGAADHHPLAPPPAEGRRGPGRHAGAVPGALRQRLLPAGPLRPGLVHRAAVQDGRPVLHADHVQHCRFRRHRRPLRDGPGDDDAADGRRAGPGGLRRARAGERGPGGVAAQGARRAGDRGGRRGHRGRRGAEDSEAEPETET